MSVNVNKLCRRPSQYAHAQSKWWTEHPPSSFIHLVTLIFDFALWNWCTMPILVFCDLSSYRQMHVQLMTWRFNLDLWSLRLSCMSVMGVVIFHLCTKFEVLDIPKLWLTFRSQPSDLLTSHASMLWAPFLPILCPSIPNLSVRRGTDRQTTIIVA